MFEVESPKNYEFEVSGIQRVVGEAEFVTPAAVVEALIQSRVQYAIKNEGTGLQEILKDKMAFFLSEVEFEMDADSRAADSLVGSSLISHSIESEEIGTTLVAPFSVSSSDGDSIAKGSSRFAVVNFGTGRPTVMAEKYWGLFSEVTTRPNREAESDVSGSLLEFKSVEQFSLNAESSFVVSREDLDQYQHVTSSRYFHHAWRALASAFDRATSGDSFKVRGSYRLPLLLGQEVKVKTFCDESCSSSEVSFWVDRKGELKRAFTAKFEKN